MHYYYLSTHEYGHLKNKIKTEQKAEKNAFLSKTMSGWDSEQ